MNRQQLIEKLRSVLGKAGFYLSESYDTYHICFDLVARRDDRLLFVKVLTNVDSFDYENAVELRMLADTLKASALLIGVRTCGRPLEDGVVYSRFGVAILTLKTLSEFFLEGVPPFVFSAPGGLYVKVDGDLMKRLREERRISLGTLAEIAGVSRRTIQMYEEGMGATVEVAIRLEEFLGQPLVMTIDPFTYSEPVDKPTADLGMYEGFKKDVIEHLGNLGYSLVPAARCPFDVFTKDRRTILLTGLEKMAKPLERKAIIVANMSKVVEKDSVIFVDKREVKYNIGGTPLIGTKELKKMREREKVLELISERKT